MKRSLCIFTIAFGVIFVILFPLPKVLADSNMITSDSNNPWEGGCSVIYAYDGELALGGNNEDYPNPFTMMWFLPPEVGKYGRVYFGYEGFIWGGGMNDQGLFFDALAVDQPMPVPKNNRTSYAGSLPDKALTECSTVDCVIEVFSNYHTYDTWYHQFLFGDAEGNSVIVEPNQFIQSDDNYQVATNFYQSTISIPTCSHCTRYNTTSGMLEGVESLSVELVRDILDTIHIEQGSPTQYSNVYDLKERGIYLYHFHNFDEVRVFDLEEELSQGYHAYTIADLFPENEEFEQWAGPELARIDTMKSNYQPIQVDDSIFEPYIGNYALPSEMGLPYPYYSITVQGDTLILKIKPDKAWLELLPLSETTYYHASSFSQFEITFLIQEDSQVNQFQYEEQGEVYTLTRISIEDIEPVEISPTPTQEPPTSTPSNLPTETQPATLSPTTLVQVLPTHTAELTTDTPKSDDSASLTYLWIIPIGCLLILGFWLILRKR